MQFIYGFGESSWNEVNICDLTNTMQVKSPDRYIAIKKYFQIYSSSKDPRKNRRVVFTAENNSRELICFWFSICLSFNYIVLLDWHSLIIWSIGSESAQIQCVKGYNNFAGMCTFFSKIHLFSLVLTSQIIQSPNFPK